MIATQGLSPSTHLSSLSPTLDSSILETSGLNTETINSPNSGFSLELLMPAETRGQLIIAPPPAAQLPVDTSTSGLFNAFYSFFFPAHPFVLPATQMLELLRKLPLNYLHLALQFIGAFYVVGADPNVCEANLRHLLATYGGPKDHFFVQTLLLYSIGLHMSDKEEESSQAMYHAIQLARDLKMNEPIYASSHGGVNSILEECLRRTWWEIWVLDGMMTGVNHTYTMQLHQIDVSKLPLPSEEAVYFRGVSSSVSLSS
jgi:hypothetical protein